MHHSVFVWLAAVALGLVYGHNTLFDGYELSMTGYHLCAGNQTTDLSSVLSYQTSYIQRRSCGGWLPWRTCEVTLYRVAYRSHIIRTHREVTQCCAGYEQVGSYCALPLNSSAEFTAKPGSCPEAVPGSPCGSQPQCGWDTDCPGWQKCCLAAGGFFCTDPPPPAEQGWCLNASITVKMTYQQMVSTEGGMLNHTRLLHSVVTGALNSSDISVHHVRSWSAGPLTTSSSLLIGSPSALVLADVFSRLQALLKHIEEVVAVIVEDMDECVHRELSKCPPQSVCVNTEGSYVCRPDEHCRNTTSEPPPRQTMPSYPSVTTESLQNFTCRIRSPSPPSSSLDAVPEITSISPFNITSSSFCVSWTVAPQSAVTFRVTILQRSLELRGWETAETEIEVNQLQAGVLYRVCVTPHACGVPGTMVEIHVKTDAQTLQAVARLTNVQFTMSLLDSESPEYKNLSQSIQTEILQSLPPDVQALVDSGKVRIVITGFSAGSVVVNFAIVFVPNASQDIMEVSHSVMASLQNSSRYTVDSNGTSVQDLDECLSGDVDCSSEAECVNTWGGKRIILILNNYRLLFKKLFKNVRSKKIYVYTIYANIIISFFSSALNVNSSVSSLPPSITSTQSTYAPRLSTDTSHVTTPSVTFTTDETYPTTMIIHTPITEGLIIPSEPVTNTSNGGLSDNQMTSDSFHTTPLDTTTAAIPTRKTTSHSSTISSGVSTPYISDITITTATINSTTTSSVSYSESMTNSVGNPATLNIVTANLTTTQTNANPTLTHSISPATTTSTHPTSTTSKAVVTTVPVMTTTSSTTKATVANEPVMTTTSSKTKATVANTPVMTTTSSTTKATVANTPVMTTTSSTTKATVTNALASTTTSFSTKAIVTDAQISPDLSSTSQPIQVISQLMSITVECKAGYMSVNVDRDFLRDKHIPEDTLYLGLSECGVNGGNASHVQLVAAWDECDTVLLSNSTDNTVQVMLYNNISSYTWPDGSVSTPSARLQVPIQCSYMKNVIISAGYSPLVYDMIKDVVQGSGSFQVAVRLLNGSTPLPENYTLSPDEEVVVEVSVNSTLSQIKVVLNRCWATPTRDPSGPVEYVFLENGCPLPNSYTTVLQNGNDSRALLAIRIFSFVDLDILYLHCQIQICFKIGESSCRPVRLFSWAVQALHLQDVNRLLTNSSWRVQLGLLAHHLSLALHLSPEEAVAQQRDTLRIVGFSLLGVGLGLLSLGGLVGALIYRRRIGTYNFSFKPRPESFTYHVFDT
ncbi:uromodulin-like 1 [Clupea harengus]|uniref:Uromodulin-like 1 n=1 Tax=Clupea harengus TaxID=7950 RepID=A0A8M1KKN3_CLUHA|nr:uromodulin-like 1 [Clupea harengus]